MNVRIVYSLVIAITVARALNGSGLSPAAVSVRTSGTVAGQAADFGFRLSVGDCLTERFDTATSVFTKDLGGWPANIVTAHITLTDARFVRRATEPSPWCGARRSRKNDRGKFVLLIDEHR